MWWPLAVFGLGAVFMWLFRVQIGAWLTRLKKVKAPGVQLDSSGQEAPTPQVNASDQLMRLVDNELLVRVEDDIRRDMDSHGVRDPTELVKVLVRHLAAARITLVHEWTSHVIWGSQVEALRYLNAAANGFSRDDFRPMYEAAAAAYPEVCKTSSFDNWVAFLKGQSLVAEQDGRYFITTRGRDFLRFLVTSGRSGDRPF